MAASHQILTLVLGEPVEIDPASRQRMYQLPEVAAEAEKASETRRREKPGVPDYLREPAPKRHRARAFALVVLAGCIVVAVLASTGQMDPWLERMGLAPTAPHVAESTGESPSESVAPPAADDSPSTETEEAPGASDAPTGPSAGADAVVEVEGAAETAVEPAATEGPMLPGAEPEVPALPAEDATTTVPPAPADSAPAESMPQESAATELQPAPGPRDLAQPMAALPGTAADSAPPAGEGLGPAPTPESIPAVVPDPSPAAETPSPAEPAPVAPGAGAAAASGSRAPVPAMDRTPGADNLLPGILSPSAPDGPAPPSQPEQVTSLGRLASDRQLLLQFDPGQAVWNRVTMQTAIQPEHPLLALPTFRPVVALPAGVTVQFIGPTQVELLASGEGEAPMLNVAYGRLLMHTLGQAGSRLRLAIGERLGTITFTAAESGVAVHVYRPSAAGSNPEGNATPLAADLWVTRGSATWQTDAGKVVEVGTSSRIALGPAASEPPIPASGATPAWVTEEQASLIDRRASAVLMDEVETSRPASLSLHEMASGHRQREVRWLAVRCLGYLGEFDPMVAVLDREDAKLMWFDYIDELRAAMARTPELATSVRSSLQRIYGADAEKMYRMLWGYSAADLQAGAAKTLVEDLEHERLAVRLLSFWNLREITGGLGLFYRPELPAAKRQQPVQRWRERLEAGEIVRKPEGQAAEQ